jgi:hypothetical protein
MFTIRSTKGVTLKQVERMTLARELLPLIDELLQTEIRRRAGSFDSEASRRAIEAREAKRKSRSAQTE